MNSPQKPRTVRVYDFFSGCGGASAGFQAAGMNIAYALDHDANARASFKINFPGAYFEFADIREVSSEGIRERVTAERPNPVLFSGCAPCQPFTKHNTTKPTPTLDDRVSLLANFANLVEKCLPDLLFVENVPGLQKLRAKSQTFENFLKRLRKAGYRFDHRPIILAHYGIPQRRCRLILVGSRHGPIFLPEETHGPGRANPSFSTVREWISDLPEIRAGESHQEVLNHRAANLSPLNLKRIIKTPEGGGNREWPNHLKLKCHKGLSGYTDVYGRMAWDAPASALTTRCISYSNGRFGHPNQNRAISIREAACLQTFPRNFVFKGNMGSMAQQIGNAVPVRLTEILGKHFIAHLNELGVLI